MHFWLFLAKLHKFQDPELRKNQGYGSEAMIVLLDMAFSVLDLYYVFLWVEAFNEHAINFYKKNRFRIQGKLRELAFRNGKRYDVVFMDILKPVFLEKNGILPKK